jgi:hypothetical protein
VSSHQGFSPFGWRNLNQSGLLVVISSFLIAHSKPSIAADGPPQEGEEFMNITVHGAYSVSGTRTVPHHEP